MRWFWKVTGAALLALGLAGGPGDAAMRLKAGHILPPTSDQGQAAEFFANRVKELTKGEIEIQVFHAGELGKSIPSQLENLVSGAQDLFIDTFDYFKAWDPRFGVVNTPFVFRDREHFKKFLTSDLFADMVASLEKRGVVFLGKGNYNWLRAGDRGLLTRTPIMKPEDLKGYKLRMFQAEAPIKAWAAFGANIQPDSLAVFPWAIAESEKIVKGTGSPNEKKLNQLMLDYPNIPYTKLSQIKAPVLIMSGDRDVIRPEHILKLFQNIPNSQLCIIPGATHGAAWEKKDLFLMIMYDFFNEPFKMPDTADWFKH